MRAYVLAADKKHSGLRWYPLDGDLHAGPDAVCVSCQRPDTIMVPNDEALESKSPAAECVECGCDHMVEIDA